MGRTRDVSKILTSNTSILTLASASTTYATKASSGLTLITPGSVSNTGGTASIGANGAVTFSGVSSQSINNVFSATYDNYKVLIKITAQITSAGAHSIKFRGAGVDKTNDYFIGGFFNYSNTGSISATNQHNGASITIGNSLTTTPWVNYAMDFFSPFTSGRATAINIASVGQDATALLATFRAGANTATTSFDGFTIFTSAGTFSGSVSVYGYNQ